MSTATSSQSNPSITGYQDQFRSRHDKVETASEEYLDAQRAAAEAVLVGRATVESVARQGEQLSHADRMADGVQYTLDKSARMLRGMTWGGWIANVFTKDLRAPVVERWDAQGGGGGAGTSDYDDAPALAKPAVQTLRNYQANLQIFACCETEEQSRTGQRVCDQMYEVAVAEANKLMQMEDPSVHIIRHQIKKDLAFLRRRQRDIQENRRRRDDPTSAHSSSATTSPTHHPQTAALQPSRSFPKTKRETRQDEHLDALAQNLGELNTMAFSLNEMMGQQTQTMTSLEEKSEAIHEKSKMVTRRADRMKQKKSWGAAKKDLHGYVTIRHVKTGKFLSSHRGTLILSDLPTLACDFELWKRPSGLFGLRNTDNNRWAGQSLMGTISCNSSSFGHREEWQADEDWNSTRLLCASAGWGSGGYITVQQSNGAVVIGEGGLAGRRKADAWQVADGRVGDR